MGMQPLSDDVASGRAADIYDLAPVTHALAPREALALGFVDSNVVATFVRDMMRDQWDGAAALPPDPHYDPFEDKAGILGYEDYLPVLGQATSRAQLDAWKHRIDQDNERRARLAGNATMGLIGSFFGATLNPSAMVGAWEVGAMGRLATALRTGVRTGLAVGGVTAIEQGIQTQLEHDQTLEDAIVNIATATLVSTVAGGLHGAIAHPEIIARRYAAEQAGVDAAIAGKTPPAEAAGLDPTPAPATIRPDTHAAEPPPGFVALDGAPPPVRPGLFDVNGNPVEHVDGGGRVMGHTGDELKALGYSDYQIGSMQEIQARRLADEKVPPPPDPEAPVPADHGLPPAGAQPVGAAVTPGQAGRTAAQLLEGEGLAPTGVGLENLPDNPIKRLLMSASQVARDAIGRLTEIPFLQKKNLEGEATFMPVWARQRTEWQPRVVQAMEETQRAYLEYRQRLAGQHAQLGPAATRSPLGQLLSDLRYGRGGAMSFAEFRRQVGWAKAELDTPAALAAHAPEVVRAARAWDGLLYTPLGKEADALDVFTLELRQQVERANVKMARAAAAGNAAEAARLDTKIKALEAKIQGMQKFGVTKAGYVNRIYLHDEIGRDRQTFEGILQNHLHVTQPEAARITDEILTTQPYNAVSDDAIGKADALKKRSLAKIPDRALQGFIERDIYTLGGHYGRTMGVDVELARAFNGEINLASVVKDIEADYAPKIQAAATAAEKAALTKQMERDVADLRAVRDLVRGTYGLPSDPTRYVSRGIRAAKYLSTMTALTGAISAIPDLARIVMTNGLDRTLRSGLQPFFEGLQGFRLAKREAQLAGEAVETWLSLRLANAAEISDAVATTSKFERALERGARFSFTINLMNQWTDAVKGVTSMVAGSRILDDAAAWARGVQLPQLKMAALASSYIDQHMAGRIAAQAQQHGLRRGSLWIANTDLWTDAEAVRAYRAALAKDINLAIVTPSPGEKPLWTSREWGSLITQFKGFSIASTNRVLTRGLQEGDAKQLVGGLILLGMGAIADQLRAGQREDGSKRSYGEQLQGAIDRSGALGYFMDVHNAVQRFTDPHTSVAGRLSIGGPAVGLALNAVKAGGDLAGGYADAKTMAAVRRVLPLQNVWWLDNAFDQIGPN